jgi:hypothetical protein
MLEIKELFKGLPHEEISATDEDVRQYLTGRIDQLQPFVQENLDLQRDITTGIAEAVDGMYVPHICYTSWQFLYLPTVTGSF